MKLQPVILQIRAKNTTFGNNVAGTAELAAAQLETYDFEKAFVTPLGSTASNNKSDAGINQLITSTFAVVVALDNRVDRRGQAANDRIDTIRVEIFNAILNWKIDTDHRPIEYVGDSLWKMNRAYLVYRFDFSTKIQITESDGVDLTADDFLHANATYDVVDDETRIDAQDDIFLDGP